MNFPSPSSAELHQLLDVVRRHAPESQGTILYLLGTLRRLSIISLERVLARPDLEPLTLENFDRTVIPGTSLEDLAHISRHRLRFSSSPSEERRLQQLLQILEHRLELEARRKVERVLGLITRRRPAR